MKRLDMKNKTIFMLLIVVLTFNILWAMRQETRADKLDEVVEQYHDRLKALEDTFPASLEKFRRTIKGQTPSTIEMDYGGTRIVSNDIALKTYDEGIGRLELSSHPEVGFLVDFGDGRLHLYDEETLLMKNENKISIGKNDVRINSDEFELRLNGLDSRVSLNSDPGFGFVADQGNNRLHFYDEEALLMKEYIGALSISRSGGVDISAKESNPVKIHGENDLKVNFDGSIEITAKGNINIKSENGKIKINGQEIHLNE